MKCFQVLTLLMVSSWPISAAWAQYGLYGSPGMVELSSVPSETTYPSWQSPPDYASRPPSVYADPWVQTTALKPAPPPEGKPPRRNQAGRLAPNVVDEMLDESGQNWPPPWGPDPGCEPGPGCEAGYGCGPFGQAVAEAGCGGGFMPYSQPKWYVSVSALYMDRDDPDDLWTTYETGNDPNQLPTFTPIDWVGGVEIRFGRRFGGCEPCCDPCCASACGGGGGWTLEGAYWTLDAFTGYAVQTHASTVSTVFDFTDVSYATIPGSPGELFDGADEHRVSRRDEVHNLEINLIRCPLYPTGNGPLDVSWSVGARYFRFREHWVFASLDEAPPDGTGLEGYLDDRISNDLVGAQLACDLDYQVGKWSLFFRPRVGIYNNHIRHRFDAYRSDGELFVTDPPGYPDYPVSSSENAISFLTEIDVGLEWQFHPKWSTHVGYRATVVTGVGLADHQIPHYIVDTPVLAEIDRNAELVLHGGFAGVTCRF